MQIHILFFITLLVQTQISVFLSKAHVCVCVCVCVSCSVVSGSLRFHGLQPARLVCPWNSPGKNTGVGSHTLLQGISPTQRLNLDFLHFRQILYHLSHQGRLKFMYSVIKQSSTKIYGILLVIALNLYIHLKRINIFIIVRLSIQNYGVFLFLQES